MKHVVLLGILLLLISCTAKSPEEYRNPELCQQVMQGNSSLNIVIGMHNLQEDLAEKYINESTTYLQNVTPFNETTYNIYTFEIAEAHCWPKNDKTVVKSQLGCDWNEVNRRIEACALQNAKVMIITGEDVQTVTVPTYYETSLSIINEREFDRYGFLHELGHQFGLQEEYITLRVKRTSPAYDPRKPNCAPNTTVAREWWGDMIGQEDTGFYNGCAGHANYIRPNKDTLMGTGAAESSYGYVNEQYLRDAVNCCFAANRSAYSCDGFFSEFPEWKTCRE